MLSYEHGQFVTLAACSLVLGPCFVEAWSLQLLAVDQDPGAKLSPGIRHDLELSRDGQELWPRSVCYFYCEFFHAASFSQTLYFPFSLIIFSFLLNPGYCFNVFNQNVLETFLLLYLYIFMFLFYLFLCPFRGACSLLLAACRFWRSGPQCSVQLVKPGS